MDGVCHEPCPGGSAEVMSILALQEIVHADYVVGKCTLLSAVENDLKMIQKTFGVSLPIEDPTNSPSPCSCEWATQENTQRKS